MEHVKKEIRRALIICVPYIVVIFFLDDLDKLLYTIHSRFGNPLLVVYMFTVTVMILVFLIYTVIDFRANYKSSGSRAAVPIIIYIIALCNSFWSPLRISSAVFQSKILYEAFRKEKYGHARMKLKENGSLSIRYPGPFGMSDWEYGHWIKNNDTFYLTYDKGFDTIASKPDSLIMATDGLLIPVGIPADTLKVYRDIFFKIPVKGQKNN